MSSFYLVLAVLQIAALQTAYCQCLNRIRSPCAETYIPNPYFIPNIPNVIPAVPNIIPAVPNIIPAVPTKIPVIPNVLPCDGLPNQLALPATTVVQDSTVANNLANALQLLVVSSLLSNTLPSMNSLPPYPYPYPYPYDVLPTVPNVPFAPCGCGPYNYVY